ncbi:hypothetical protein PMI09_02312 [Rhizobium sp. CF122]|uniref:hypothetical protein n=1 Tax=Rhizobium sp. CF122 TaxID=1144312 RepID=UPI000271642D|nr:hypothetical protein [Rhizobium sp. CF122]EJL54571.1 hypothetical protein PMI09_02312 [Rhizobium sp. CF122]
MTCTTKRLQSIFQTQARNADIGAKQIYAVSIHLAQLMHNFHGDISGQGWEVCISHDAGVELILVKPARTPSPPTLSEILA